MPLKEYTEQTGRNLFSRKVEYEEPVKKGTTAQKQEQKTTLKVQGYDADPQSVLWIVSRLAHASVQYDRLIAEGTTAGTAYTQVYEADIQWKDANNTVKTIQVKDLESILQDTLTNVEQIIGV